MLPWLPRPRSHELLLLQQATDNLASNAAGLPFGNMQRPDNVASTPTALWNRMANAQFQEMIRDGPGTAPVTLRRMKLMLECPDIVTPLLESIARTNPSISTEDSILLLDLLYPSSN